MNNAGLSIELATLDPTDKQTMQICLYRPKLDRPYAFWTAAASEPSRGFVQTTAAVFESSICVSATMGGVSLSTSKVCVPSISILRRLLVSIFICIFTAVAARALG